MQPNIATQRHPGPVDISLCLLNLPVALHWEHITTGIGNGSTFRMIPVIFMTERMRAAKSKGAQVNEQVVRDANKEAAAVLGFTSAIGAYGGFFIPKSYGTSIAATGGPEVALYVFMIFYCSGILMTWWYYLRKNAEIPC
jgi:NNP family nitrate/nitrite transporter-like MFS transporter